MTCLELLDRLTANESLDPIDRAFADFVCRAAGVPDNSPLAVVAALVSNFSTRLNNVCLPLDIPANGPALFARLRLSPPSDGVYPYDTLPNLTETYPAVVGTPEHDTDALLVVSDGLLYLQRNFRCERAIIDFLERRSRIRENVTAPVFPDPRTLTTLPLNDEQSDAAARAAKSDFFLISGGPGVGKTTIISLILAMRFLTQAETPPRVLLCAPTGKAQSRMKEALSEEIETHLKVPDAIRAALSAVPCSTIHRLLRYQPNSASFHFTADNPLPCDLLVVDEASMIPQSLMRPLLAALPPDASLLILGDRGQLASVEAGAVFAEFCDVFRDDPAHLAVLRTSHRFRPDKGIGKLKDLLDGSVPFSRTEVWRVLTHGAPELLRLPLPEQSAVPTFLAEITQEKQTRPGGWLDPDGRAFCEEAEIGDAWTRFESLRVLSPLNAGPYGVARLNRALLTIFGFSETARPAKGLPVIVTRNDYGVRLFNGDVGLLWPGESPSEPCVCTPDLDLSDKLLYAFFPEIDASGKRGWRGVPAGLLPEHAPAFAVSVHKAQGSGFGRIVFLLPPDRTAAENGGGQTNGAALLTRELVYTAVTRARYQAEVVCAKETLEAAAEHPTRRAAGIARYFAAQREESRR